MANTQYLTKIVEDYVRERLSADHGVAFARRRLRLQTGGEHEFGAVASNGSLVASIKTASGRTAGGKNPSGKVMYCIAELYFLSLVRAPYRKLILTSLDFYEIFGKAMKGKIVSGIEIVHLPLPSEMQARVASIQRTASEEVSPTLDAHERRAFGDR